MSRPFTRRSPDMPDVEMPGPRGPIKLKGFPVRQPTLEQLWDEADRAPRRYRI